jgi:hypothetical protein
MPLVESADGTYAPFGFIGQSRKKGNEPTGSWSVRQLIGDFARIATGADTRHALVVDVIFSDDGTARAVVARRVGSPVGPGWDYVYAHQRQGGQDQSVLRAATLAAQLFEYVPMEQLRRFAERSADEGYATRQH